MEIDQENTDTKPPESYCKDLMVQMNECRTTKSLCDVNVVVEAVEFPAHRIVLAVGSPFFHGLFTSEMKEKQENKVVLKEVKASVMENILEYLYTGKTEVTVENAHDLMASASYFLMDDLKEAASSCISEHLELTNCLKAREFAEKYICASLMKKCKEFIKDNFDTIIDHDLAVEEFLNLEVEKIEEFFSSENTFICREEVMYETIKKWVKKSPATREKHFKTLFRHVRLQHISMQYINKIILEDELVTGDVACIQFVHQSTSTTGSLPLPLKPRKCVDNHIDVIVISGGIDDDYVTTTSVMCFIPNPTERKKWRMLPPLSTARNECCSVFCGGFLYCIGGLNDAEVPVNVVDRYEPVTNSWLKVKPLPKEEKWVSAASLNGCLYVLSMSHSLYCYTPSLNAWHDVESFEGEIHHACFVADSSSLYIIGGLDANNLVTSACRKFDPQSKKCISLASMNVERYSASAVFNKDHIYIAGGLKDYESNNALESCEVYSIKNDQWEMLSNLQYTRDSALIACVWDDIYFLGGQHEIKTERTVQHYNESKQEWEVVSFMPYHSYFSCTWIRIPQSVLSNLESISIPDVET